MLRIFTDTAANIPPHLLEQYHITAMPLTYLLDGQPTELVGHDYYEAMRKGAEVKTSLVSPALIREHHGERPQGRGRRAVYCHLRRHQRHLLERRAHGGGAAGRVS